MEQDNFVCMKSLRFSLPVSNPMDPYPLDDPMDPVPLLVSRPAFLYTYAHQVKINFSA